jgi:hypothetical protein
MDALRKEFKIFVENSIFHNGCFLFTVFSLFIVDYYSKIPGLSLRVRTKV